ncbi:MAG: VCBS repeat-containing protein, partial [Myxococcota bacterium]|nr:VCBS repeat-containing protein [Myxococcota bacterium]
LCDIDGDGKMDLLTGSTNEGYVYFGNGITTLAKTYGVGTGLDANTSGAVHGVCLPDANLDGKPDLAFPVRSGGGYVNIRH